MKDKLKMSLICALAALIAGPLLLCFLTGGIIAKTALACIITGVVIAGIVFGLTYYLDGKSIKKTVPVYILTGIVAFFALLSVLIISIAPAFVFYPHFEEDDYEQLQSIEGTAGHPAPVAVTAAEGTISGWRLPATDVAEGKDRNVILMFMGNGMESSSYSMFVLEHSDIYGGLNATNDLVFFDYPQYGLSEGDLTTKGLKNMAIACYEAVAALPDTEEVIVMGYSLGTGLACYVASEEDAAGLILFAPYKDVYDMYNNMLNIFHGPLRLLVRYKIDSVRYARKVTCPVLIIASDADEIIPYRSSQALFAGFTGSSVDFVTMNGIGHNDFLDNTQVIDRACEFAGGV